MLTKPQIALIHTAKSRLQLSDDDYRDLLGGLGVASSKDLNYPGFLGLMKAFEKLGFSNKQRSFRRVNPAEARDTGTVKLATGKQQRFIIALWMQSETVKQKDHDALRKFIKRIASVDKLEWLPTGKVQKVIKAIQSLKVEVME
jgi:hypothetical protein